MAASSIAAVVWRKYETHGIKARGLHDLGYEIFIKPARMNALGNLKQKRLHIFLLS